jgi:predicted ester cyclase
MAGDALKAAYRRWLLEVWGAGRYEVADELLHVDLVDHNRLDGQADGRAGDVWAAGIVRRAFPDLRFVPDLVVADGEYVVGRWTMTRTNTGPFDLFGLPPTGRPVTMTGQEIFRSDGEPSSRSLRGRGRGGDAIAARDTRRSADAPHDDVPFRSRYLGSGHHRPYAQPTEEQENPAVRGLRSGPWRTRTSNLGIKSPLLYQLS